MQEPHLAEKKKHQEEAKLLYPDFHPAQSFSMPHYTEKPGGLLCHQMTKPPGNKTTEVLLKYQHQDWMLKEKHQNYQD
jgi:hypothetical protein